MPLKGTSHCISENRSLAGLVQICFWSSKNSFPSPLMLRGSGVVDSDSGSSSIFFFVTLFFVSTSELLCLTTSGHWPSDCGSAARDATAVTVRVDAAQLNAITIRVLRLKSIVRHGWIYATAKAIDEAIDADCMIRAQLRPPIFGAFSGTTIVSPPRKVALIGSPPHQPSLLFFAAITEPSARMTNTAFLSASCVTPPAWLRYHLALCPGR